MIGIIYPQVNKKPVRPITIDSYEIQSYDFTECSENVFQILNCLKLFNIIKKPPFSSSKDVLSTILKLVSDIDIEIDEFQQAEYSYIRVVYVDYMLAVEVVIGV